MESIKSRLVFSNYIVNKIEFNNNILCDNKEIKIDFDIDSKIDFINENEFIVSLFIEIFKNAEENNYPFNFKAEITGMFAIDGVNEKEKFMYAEQNAVAILFPYIRALVTSYTAASNVQPLILPAINVASYLKQKKQY